MTRYEYCVEFSNLSKSYFDGDKEIKIVDNVSAGFRDSKITLLLGRSGSGKSTLLNLISGVDIPSAGSVVINNSTLNNLSENNRTLFRRKHIGIIFQSFHLIPSLTVLENVLFPLELNNIDSSSNNEAATELLEKVGLIEKADVFPDTLSGGEKQRAAIARAIVHDPKIILADEPTGNLDNITRDHIVRILFDLVKDKNKTLIMATHSEDLIVLSDGAYFIENHKLKSLK
ncbi:MAG: ABC transporter ATP-binding protein [Candidatus Dadabacteria bacterium]|nr:ABC transporter ATP-binding protein [Candidatus Dadabacteria bacterium]NIS10010.1 ABC transporter ATP-binding protein [Candidatus Dadabacteria bacterium]NIV42016.1 ATP-binding cassette domain-containing protein [Candidatus Dadabacteria bacterium]NIX15226.1 ATP-binding cassette domain-containing protein [Candidatus Dadabacteria bacterium]NIY22982.1 ATP-binding cassette domain-containing protein [Candidatus Dadabacteria bacterium]